MSEALIKISTMVVCFVRQETYRTLNSHNSLRQNMSIFKLITGSFLVLSPTFGLGHGGGLDENGGHHNRKNGTYHCHREACFRRSKTQIQDSSQGLDTAQQPQSTSAFCRNLSLFGNPSPEETLLCKTAFAVGHSCSLRSARWVAYFVNENSPIDLDVDRVDEFRADATLVPECRKELADFGTGYDKGHLVSSKTLDWTQKINSETFLLSNISPQEPGFNRAIWRGLENRERKWAKKRGKLFVIAGPVFSELSRISLDRLHIASHFYKIIFDYQALEAKAFLFPHRALKTGSLNRFEVTIDEIETITGLDFFSALETNAEELLESSKPINDW